MVKSLPCLQQVKTLPNMNIKTRGGGEGVKYVVKIIMWFTTGGDAKKMSETQ